MTQPAIKHLDSLSLSSKNLGILVKAFIEKGLPVQFTARGDSMFPFIKDGDTITVSPYNEMAPERGDIVAYIDAATEKLIVHRILSFKGSCFTAKGDNCFHRDAEQPQGQILGYISDSDLNTSLFYGINFIATKRIMAFFSQINLTARFVKHMIYI